jgi:uncharacterized protein YbbK (DUF523 family)
MTKPTLIISACLYGSPVRYDGQAAPLQASLLKAMEQHYEIIPVCPECMSGLSTPREAAEIVGGNGSDVLAGNACVKSKTGSDLSAAFINGAYQVLETAKKKGTALAILKANSPSCGAHSIYDGSFNGKLQPGSGVTAALLQKNGIRVLSDENIHLEGEL